MPTPRSVRFSRTLGVADAIALAAPIALAVGLFNVAPLILTQAGSKVQLVYPLVVLLLLPIWLALTEHSSAAVESGSPYSVARSGAAWAQFAIGSLSLFGYLAVAILVLGLATNLLSTRVHEYFGTAVHPFWWAALLLLLTGLRVLTGGTAWTRTRALLAWAALLVPVVAVVVGFLQRGSSVRELPEVEPLKYWLTSVALMGAALWAIEPVLARRPELRRPGRTILLSSTVVWLGLAVVSALASALVLSDPEIHLENWLNAAAPGRQQIALLTLLASVFLCVVALVRASVAATRLADRMASDGYLPSWLAPGQEGEASASGVALFLLVTGAAASSGLSRSTVIGIAAVSFFLVTTLVLLPWARTEAAQLPRRRYPRLPLHPLVPGTAICVSLFLALLLPPVSLAIAAVGWGLSAAVWFLYSRSHALRSAEAGPLVGSDDPKAESPGFRVLVAAAGADSVDPLLRIALPLARRQEGEVVVLRVVERSARAFPSQLRRHAEAVHRELEHETEGAHPDDRILALVRIAPTEAAGIVATAAELDAQLLLLPWHGGVDEPSNDREEHVLEEVFARTGRPIAVLHGEQLESRSKVTVATSGGPHAPYALGLAHYLAPENATVELLTVVSSSLPPARGDEILERTLAACEVELVAGHAELRAVSAPKTQTGLLDACRDSNLLLVGAAVDRFMGKSYLGGLSAEVALGRSRATLVVKRKERTASFLLRRIWQLVSEPLPKLTVSERSEVFLSMRFAARADIDFYVLILLSSALATFGLRQNSTAVVIGAMLVAPLMSPILALAHGLIQGHLQMIRRAAVSTAQGVATVVGVSALIGILWPESAPTQEMISRGAPTLLDLAVAVAAGAAAAYGVSRKSVAASLPGVAIAVALVPPLCVTGHGLGDSEFALAAGSFLLFLTNFAGIVLVGALVFLLLGFRPSTASRDERVRRGLLLAGLTILLLAIPLGFEGRSLHQVQTLEAMLEEELRERGTDGRADNLRVEKVDGVLVITGSVFLYGELDRAALIEAQRELGKRIGAPVKVDLTLVPARQLELEPPGRRSRTDE